MARELIPFFELLNDRKPELNQERSLAAQNMVALS